MSPGTHSSSTVGGVSGLDQRNIMASLGETRSPGDEHALGSRTSVEGENGQPQVYGTIVVVGGGCYGSYYVRQLGRARAADALTWKRVIVVDRDPQCAVGRSLAAGEVSTPAVELVTSNWDSFFGGYLDSACADAAGASADAIVPSPLMPHLMFEWVLSRAKRYWPSRVVETKPVAPVPGMPWQRSAPDGTRYVSFAEWICPVNCIEPATCPKTRGPRWWTMPAAVQSYVASTNATTGQPLARPVIFHCTHRAYGVGMFDTATAVQADALIREAPRQGAVNVIVGTVSHCHGALSVLTIGAADGENGGIAD